MRQCFSSACPYASSVARRARIKPSTSLQEATPAALRRTMESMGPRHCLIYYLATHGLLSTIQGESDMGIFCDSRVKSCPVREVRENSIKNSIP
jgi:hypothetical protein